MKTNLNDIGLMIHFRRDVDDRFRNLKTVIEFYRNNSENLQIVVVNDDVQLDKDMKDLCKTYNVKGLFLENSDVYWRTKAFNEASKLLECACIIAGDTDVIVDPKFLLKAKEQFLENEKIGIVYPYNGMFIHLKQPMFEIFDKKKTLVDLLENSKNLKPIPYDQDENFLVAHPHSKGGMVMFSKKAFIECNGYNPNFRGWGFEDDEVSTRFIKLNWIISRVEDKDAIAWHLPHDNTVRDKHPYYNDNYKHSEFVGHCMDMNLLKKYINNWKI